MFKQAKWIRPALDLNEVEPLYGKKLALSGKIASAVLKITAMGVYEANINGVRVSDYVLAPGWTSYYHRLQVQTYDVTALLKEENELTVLVGKGWYHGYLPFHDLGKSPYQAGLAARPKGLIAELTVTYADGKTEIFATDESWNVSESAVRFSELYDGEIVDANVEPDFSIAAECFDGPDDTLIEQEGEEIREQEQIPAMDFFYTPKGELVIDFGQNLTGYVVTNVTAEKGEKVDLSFAEVMDKEGNFYTENYRAAKAQYIYTCREGEQVYKPKLTFWGFRYIRVNAFPGGINNAKLENFTAVVVHSELKRTGWLKSSNSLLNQLFDNIVWGQKGNFLDVPTDCPQRDERLGWTGDAQVFIRTAALNYDVQRFFNKWFADMRADQRENGIIGHVIPDVLQDPNSSAAWGDAATICPWEMYLAYGDKQVLADNFDMMCKWLEYPKSVTKDEYLWTGSVHFGDWLGLDSPNGTGRGATREDFIASAFHAHSVALVIAAGKVLGKDVSAYEAYHAKVVEAFRKAFPVYTTQTECALAALFDLAEDKQKACDQLAEFVKAAGVQLRTGFVGAPYLLHVLSMGGYHDLAYSLLLRTEYPSWLYSVTKGATTIWEHWDGIMENGDFWSAGMNSFNHYAYGSVADWVYTVALGINRAEPGYAKARIAPHPDERLDWLKGVVDTRYGRISSEWKKQEKYWRFDITTPVETEVVIGEKTRVVAPGSYSFFEKR